MSGLSQDQLMQISQTGNPSLKKKILYNSQFFCIFTGEWEASGKIQDHQLIKSEKNKNANLSLHKNPGHYGEGLIPYRNTKKKTNNQPKSKSQFYFFT